MKTLGFHHLAVQVRDVQRVTDFYVQVLGLSEVRRFVRDDGSLRSVWVSAGEGFLAIEAAPDFTAAGTLGFSMVALRIDPQQRRSIVDELARAGVAIEKQTGWTLYVKDPEGNLVGLSHHPHDAPAV
ncbi:MAG: glyoxalase [Archangium gephyra]|uniref:Glyoxalase n=1 Tax=Archangium gephyra TaxID=48 RepID=A0A2W5VTY6_9BACT|nr:MAG: glyoxalase [Archangium gephyra]